MNTVRLFHPHPVLKPLIKMVLVKKVAPWNDNSRKIYSYPPTPVHCIILYLGGPVRAKKQGEDYFSRQPECVIVGPQITPVELELKKNHRAVMIGFQPGGLFRFLGIPMKEMFDDGIDGFHILDRGINNLIDELRETQHPEEVNAKVQTYLLHKTERVRELQPLDKALKKLYITGNNYTMDLVAQDACLSLRQFQRKCHERLGMNPKLYARIARFSKAYMMYEGNRQLTWSQISHRCGYFDQMHFIKDFKEFAGVTPGLMSKKLDKSDLSFQAPMNF